MSIYSATGCWVSCSNLYRAVNLFMFSRKDKGCWRPAWGGGEGFPTPRPSPRLAAWSSARMPRKHLSSILTQGRSAHPHLTPPWLPAASFWMNLSRKEKVHSGLFLSGILIMTFTKGALVLSTPGDISEGLGFVYKLKVVSLPSLAAAAKSTSYIDPTTVSG